MTCPFCAAPLIVRSDRDLGEGETGGTSTIIEYACTACAAEIRYCVVEKYRYVDERWFLRAPPHVFAGAHATYQCPQCDGRLCGTRPPDATTDHLRPQPETAVHTVDIDYVCAGCAARFRDQHGRWSVLGPGMYEALAAPPLPVIPRS